MKSIYAICIVFIFIYNVIFPNFSYVMVDALKGTAIDENTLLEGGWIKELPGVLLLHTEGSYYKMGYQHGYLLKERIQRNILIYFNFYESKGTTYNDFHAIWNATKPYVPDQIIEEMQGIADGSGIPFETIAVSNIVPMKYHCALFSAYGPATSSGDLYFTRSLDYTYIKDPVTGEEWDTQMMIIREPEEGFVSMYPGFTGFAYCYGGINEKGISIAHATSYCNDETYNGTHLRFRMKEVLDHASTVQEAVQIMNANKTCGYNIIIADGKTNENVLIEQNANISYVGTWNQSDEANHPCWPIDHVIRRTNFYVNKTLAASQRPCFDPRNPINYLKILENIRSEEFRGLPSQFWFHYKALSQEIEKRWGFINLSDAMDLIRDVYNGKNNIMFKINDIQWNIIHFGYYSIHQWVACPKTGDMLISFATSDISAFKQPVMYFNLFELKAYVPP